MRRLRNWAGLRMLSGLLVGSIVDLAIPGHAFAHNGAVHRDMTDLSYQVMRQVAFELNAEYPIPRAGSITGNPGVDPAEWEQFLKDIRTGVKKLAFLPDDPSLVGSGIYDKYHPGGIFNDIKGTDLDTVASFYSGRTLGHWAESIDGEADDTHVWYRPTSVGVFGFVKGAWEKVWKTAIAAALAPLLCIAEFIFGGDDCVDDAKAAASDSDLVTKAEGLIPGIGDSSGDPYTTMWHFINVQDSPIVSNDYDDRQGLYYLEAAWLGPMPDVALPVDPLDVALLVGTSMLGLSLKYSPSNGPKRYEITSGGDFHKATLHRTKGQWQSLPLGLTAFEPVDNLGKFGWDSFRTEASPAHNRHWLGWPLHAIGDASAPHHVIGTTGWGHRPYEDAEALRWNDLRYVAKVGDGGDSELSREPQPSEVIAQALQGRRILYRAFQYRKLILSWRAAHAGKVDAGDIPVRDVVTTVAQETLAHASSQMKSAWWPFMTKVSLAYAAEDEAGVLPGGKGVGIAAYAPQMDRVRPLIELGCGASIAFLMSAMEVLP